MSIKSPDAVDVAVGNRIREARLEAGISQEALAGHLGVTFQQVQKYEKGTNRCGPSRLMKISLVFKKDISWFYSLAAPGRNGAPSVLADTQKLALSRKGRRLATAFMSVESTEARSAFVHLIEVVASLLLKDK